jgi:hypothetical protein
MNYRKAGLLLWMVGMMAVIMFYVFSTLAHGSTTKPRPNTLGVEEVYQNPNTYLIAEPVEVTFMQDEKERVYTNVRFQPLNTAAFYDESILFCGTVENFKRLPMAITYLTRANQMYKGIACHEFISAYEVK